MGRRIAPRSSFTTLVCLPPHGWLTTCSIALSILVNLQYEPRAVCGKPPTARGYHVSIIADSRLFVFGGVSLFSFVISLAPSHDVIQFNGHDVFDDVHVLDLAGAAYLPQVMSFRIDVE